MKNRYLKVLGLACVLSLGLVLKTPLLGQASQVEPLASAWVNNQYYDENGNLSIGLVKVDGKTYYFDQSGHLNPNQVIEVEGIFYRTLADGSVLEGNGFTQEGNHIYYLDEKGVALGLKMIDQDRYYFNENGQLVKNSFIVVDGYTYYATESGKLASGWATIQNKTYYFNPVYHFMLRGGIAAFNGNAYYFTNEGYILEGPGFKEYLNKTYYVNENGGLAKGFIKDSGEIFYADPTSYEIFKGDFLKVGEQSFYALDNGSILQARFFEKNNTSYYAHGEGALASGFTRVDGKLYYFNPVYHFMLKNGLAEIYGKTYLFRADGSILEGSGFIKEGENTFYIGEKGLATGLNTIHGKKYLFSNSGVLSKSGFLNLGPWLNYYTFQDGSLASGWTRIDGKLYYFNPSFNTMLKGGVASINGVNYLFRADGSVLEGNGFIKEGNDTYYIGPKGIAIGPQKINGKQYIFSSQGVMGTPGFFNVDQKTYYINEDGSLASGWTKINEALYRFDTSTNVLYKNGVFDINGNKYLIDAEGKLIEESGLKEFNRQSYYVKEDKTLHTGWLNLGNDTYYFEPKTGALAKNKVVNVSGKLYFFDQNGQKVTKSGIQTINNTLYYIGSNGELRTGWQYLNGLKYYFNPVYGFGLKGGLAQIGNSVYLFNADGSVYKGWRNDGGKLYYYHHFNGFQYKNVAAYVDGKVRLFDTNGVNIRQHGLHKVGGHTYYVQSNGEVLNNGGIFTYEGTKYINQGVFVYPYVPSRGWDVHNGVWHRYDAYGNSIDASWAGSNFVVISIDQQTMWVYNGGREILSTPVVTGLRGRMDTPRGKYRVNRKESPSVLVGPDYRTRVDYWIPFVGNMIGIHDAPWQPWFGGNRYTFGGSHGCVNTPGWAIGSVYRNVSVGTPVIVY